MKSEAIDPDKVAAFLADLTALTQKHGIEIAGCGCCGSPYLWEIDYPGEYMINGPDDWSNGWTRLTYVNGKDLQP